jgi:hypothetical protein
MRCLFHRSIMVDFGGRVGDSSPPDARPNIYMYDTLGSSWTRTAVIEFIKNMFPRWKNLETQANGASCGPWVFWLIMGFVANVHGWRQNSPHPIFHTRYALTAYDLLGNHRPERKSSLHRRFWKALQGAQNADDDADLQALQSMR